MIDMLKTVWHLLGVLRDNPDKVIYVIGVYMAIVGVGETIAQWTENKKDDVFWGKVRGTSITIIKLLIKPIGIKKSEINFGGKKAKKKKKK